MKIMSVFKVSDLTVFPSILLALFIIGVFLWIKYSFERQKLSKRIPSIKQSHFRVLGDISYFPMNCNGISKTTLLLQYIMAASQFFKNEHVYCLFGCYLPFIFFNSPEAVEQALSGTKMLSKAFTYDWLHSWIGLGLLTSAGAKWKSRRKLLTPAFHFDILKDFLPIINEKSMLFVKKLEKECNQEYINIILPTTMCSLDIICETTLGVDIKAQENNESDYVKALGRFLENVTVRILNVFKWWDTIYYKTFSGQASKKDIDLLHRFTISVIQQRKEQLLNDPGDITKKKRKPLIEILLEHHIKTQDLTEEDIREEVDTFTFEGHDTTASAMIWAMHNIGLEKHVQAKIHEELDQIFGEDNRLVTKEDLSELKYLEKVIKETLRLYPPVFFFGRKTEEDVNICGYDIPKGVNVFVLPYAIHRNEKIYPNPEVFDPERFTPENSSKRNPFSYIPFSAGSRNCIGQRFAMMELKTVLANVLRTFSLHSLDTRDKCPPCFEIIMRSSTPIRIKFTRRK